jgi:signal transduction histidine kinase
VLVLTATTLLAVAAVAFYQWGRTEKTGRPVLLAAATLLLAGASGYHLVSHSLTPGQITPGEVLRLFAFALILASAVQRERGLRADAARAAVLAERQRVARDLHDGLAQDLAFIVAHGKQIAEVFGPGHPVAVAAQRALDVSRGAIVDLSSPIEFTTQEALEQVAHELRDRFQIAVHIDAAVDPEPVPEQRAHLARIAREAIANAARHGRASTVVVSLSRSNGGWSLRVKDDGRGLVTTQRREEAGGFGLASMREQAVGWGGSLSVREPPGGGTELEVVLP